MNVLTPSEFKAQLPFYLNEMKKGKIFIYPTDTIYGIGCNALDATAVATLRQLKQRDERPYSIIAPSKQWICEVCTVGTLGEDWLKKLPGPYTLIFSLRNIQKELTPVCGGVSLGVRIPAHWFSEIVAEVGVPFITTSVNISGQAPISRRETLPPEIAAGVDYFIDEGILEGSASTVVQLVDGKEVILRR